VVRTLAHNAVLLGAGLCSAQSHVEFVRIYGSVAIHDPYVVDLFVGNPPQRVPAALDTTSAVVSVASGTCEMCGSDSRSTFSVWRSRDAARIPCGAECPGRCVEGHCCLERNHARGFWFTDVARIGSVVQERLAMLEMADCQCVLNSSTSNRRIHAVLGLAPDARERRAVTLQQLFRGNPNVHTDIFSLCLTSRGGALLVGGNNKSLHTGPMQRIALGRHSDGYEVNVSGLRVNGSDFELHLGAARIQTGASFTSLATFHYKALKDAIRSYCDRHNNCGGGSLRGECWTLPLAERALTFFPGIEVFFGNMSTSWTPMAYLYRRSATTWCYAFVDGGENAQTVLGKTWMLHKELTFDLTAEQLSIAPADCPEVMFNGEVLDIARRLNTPSPSPSSDEQWWQKPLFAVLGVLLVLLSTVVLCICVQRLFCKPDKKQKLKDQDVQKPMVIGANTYQTCMSWGKIPSPKNKANHRLSDSTPRRHSTRSLRSGDIQDIISDSAHMAEDSSSDNEMHEDPLDRDSFLLSSALEHPLFLSQRRFGVSAEASGAFNQRRADFRPDTFNKTRDQVQSIVGALKSCPLFCETDELILSKIADTMEIQTFEAEALIIRQGDFGRSGYVLLEGIVDVYEESWRLSEAQLRMDPTMSVAPNRHSCPKTPDSPQNAARPLLRDTKPCKALQAPRFFGEMTMLWGIRRTKSIYARGACVCAKLKRDCYLGLVSRGEMKARNEREKFLREVEMFETLSQEHIAQIADALEKKTFKPGVPIVTQGDEGSEFYVVLSGQCRATIATGSNTETADVQEHRTYERGGLFGERALIHRTERAATVTAVGTVEVLCLKRSKFERMLGPLQMLQKTNYLRDPRKCIADFYSPGSKYGPLGSLRAPPSSSEPRSHWFAVYRPCSRCAIAKMLSGQAVGKGLNVKGKSARMNHMAGYVPFLQISKEEHKELIEKSDPCNRLEICYMTEVARDVALAELTPWLKKLPIEGERAIKKVDTHPNCYGLDVPECVCRKVYIMQQDITFLSGWETGRVSEPQFMDFNLHAACGKSTPKVVLYQMDAQNPMNPHGLLIAYAEALVKPVVSDFDTFTVGSRGMSYEKLPTDQQDLAKWALSHAENILRKRNKASWNSRWLAVLKEANAEGFNPLASMPPYGWGDKTSYELTKAAVEATIECGAVRHGAECFNFYFPQELDPEYLVVWEGFNKSVEAKPWAYLDEEELRAFLYDRIQDGYSFPLNPVWPVRDTGWYEVFNALEENPLTRSHFSSWYPPGSGIREKIKAIHEEFPEGFVPEDASDDGSRKDDTRISVIEDVDAGERADLLLRSALGSVNNNGSRQNQVFSPVSGGINWRLIHTPKLEPKSLEEEDRTRADEEEDKNICQC